jgi:hypothetical protein
MLPSLHRSTPILLLTLLHYYYYTTHIIPPLLSNGFLTLSFSTPTALLNKNNLTLSGQRHAYNYFPNKASYVARNGTIRATECVRRPAAIQRPQRPDTTDNESQTVKAAAKTRILPRRHIAVFQLTELRRSVFSFKIYHCIKCGSQLQFSELPRRQGHQTCYFVSHLLVVQEQWGAARHTKSHMVTQGDRPLKSSD